MSPSAVAAAEWTDLLARIAKAPAESLDDLLEAWRVSTGLEGAALYVDDDSVRRRRARSGSGDFADVLPEDEDGFGRLELGRSVVLYRPGAAAVAVETGPMEALLSQSGHISRLRDRLRRQHFQDSYRLVELEAIYELGLAIASTLDLDQLSDEILLRAVSLCDARRGALYLKDAGAYVLSSTIGGDARADLAVDEPVVDELFAAHGAVDQDVLPEAEYPLAVPIEVDGKRRGLLAVADKESRQGVGPFLETDRRTLGLFANQAAIALENARLHQQALEKERLEREMELAAEIQQRLLPKGAPSLEGFELAGWNCPAWQVGGDYYDYMNLSDGRLGLVVADVTGKGMPAALLVSTLHSALRFLVEGTELAAPLFSQLNEHIVDSSSPNKFITLILVELDPGTGGLRVLNAGHNPGLLVKADGRVAELGAGGMPLGLIAGSRYDSSGLEMDHGDVLCLYSDGITECESPTEEEFGLDRLRELLLDMQRKPLAEVLRTIEEATRDFAAGRPQGDDQTVVLLRRCG